MSDTQGNFVWYELMTTDVKGAIAFYEDAIGWGTQAYEGAGAPYSMWTAGGTPIGGVTTLPDDARKAGAPPHWLAYVSADDVDALTRKAQSLDAKVLAPPNDIPTVGRFSIIADPHGGAVIALFKGSGGPMSRPTQPTNGHFSWHELIAGNESSAFRFYAQLFGWDKMDAMDMGAMGTYQLYGKSGRMLGGMMTRPENHPAPPHWLYYVWVDDLDATLARVKKGGGQVLNGPMEVPGGDRIAQCLDPQGAAFAVHGK
jgi:predicted enzyme related to lactoylglutathione lyase